MGLSIPLPKTGHITCYRTGQVIYYRHKRHGPCHRTGIVLESVPETFDMNRVYAFWFYFYGFPQPLAEGLS